MSAHRAILFFWCRPTNPTKTRLWFPAEGAQEAAIKHISVQIWLWHMAAENCEWSHYFLTVNDFKVGSTSSQKDPHKIFDPHLDIFSRLLCFGFRLMVLVLVWCLFVDEEVADSYRSGIYVLSFGQNAKSRKSKEGATESQSFLKHLTYFFLLDFNGALRRCQG